MITNEKQERKKSVSSFRALLELNFQKHYSEAFHK